MPKFLIKNFQKHFVRLIEMLAEICVFLIANIYIQIFKILFHDKKMKIKITFGKKSLASLDSPITCVMPQCFRCGLLTTYCQDPINRSLIIYTGKSSWSLISWCFLFNISLYSICLSFSYSIVRSCYNICLFRYINVNLIQA